MPEHSWILTGNIPEPQVEKLHPSTRTVTSGASQGRELPKDTGSKALQVQLRNMFPMVSLRLNVEETDLWIYLNLTPKVWKCSFSQTKRLEQNLLQ